MSRSKSGGSSRALARRPTSESELRVFQDPITIGLDKSVKVDFEKLTSPTSVYDADVAWIEHVTGSASLFFGKRDRDEAEKLRTRLELRYPVENLVNHFWRNSRSFHQNLKKFVETWPPEAMTNAIDARGWKAGKDHSESANFEAIAHAGTEATLDFYSIPAFGIARFSGGAGSSSLKIVPVVRINISVFELCRLMDSVSTIIATIEEYLPASVNRANSKEDEDE